MVYGTEVIMRGARFFDYKRVDAVEPNESGGRLIWRFVCKGIYDPRNVDNANSDGYVRADPDCVLSAMISAITEKEAVEELRSKLNPDGIDYSGTHWDLEQIGVDIRPSTQPEIIQLQYWGY